jgi:hypothetical protein
MRFLLRSLLTVLACVAVAVGVTYWLVGWDLAGKPHPVAVAAPSSAGAVQPPSPYPRPGLTTFPNPNAPPSSSARVFIDPVAFDALILAAVAPFTDRVRDQGSLREYRQAIAHRDERAKARLEKALDCLRLDPTPTTAQASSALWIYRQLAFVAMFEGAHDAAASWLQKGPAMARTPGVPPEVPAHMAGLLDINAMRRGEQDNCIACVGPSSCIFPISPEARHTRPAGSRQAVRWFTEYLDNWPGDLRVRWLRNLAEMTLGDYPDRVPPRYRIPLQPFRSKLDVGRFENVATPVGHGASLEVNRGDGTFEDRSAKSGLDDQVYALNVARADSDNDGRLDLFVSNMDSPARLYHNEGNGTFRDVAPELGIVGPPKGFTCLCWDYDNDGRLDLFVGDFNSSGAEVVADYLGPPVRWDNHAHLYHNLGPGGFREVSREVGLARPMAVMSVNAGDIDNDGDLDLHFGTGWMNLSGLVPDLTYVNVGGHFEDVTDSSGTGQKGHGVSFAD